MGVTNTDKALKDKISDYIDSMRDDMVATLSELISYPSCRQDAKAGAPFGEDARRCLDRALEICSGFGLKTRCFDGYAGTAELYGESGDGKEPAEPVLGILAHLDVVPAGDGWSFEPFCATVSQGKVYGRGAIDDKGPAVAAMYAAKAVKDLNIPIKDGVRLIFGTDEECGSSDLEYYFKKEAPPKYSFTPDASYPVINIEKGMIRGKLTAKAYTSLSSRLLIELEGGTVVNAVPGTAYAVVSGISADEVAAAEKKLSLPVEFDIKEFAGLNTLRITAVGKSAHASTPELGKNAVTALMALISELGLADEASELVSKLSKLFPYGETDGKSMGLKISDRLSGSLTCVLSVISYSSGQLEAKFDIRLPVSSSVEQVLSKLKPAVQGAGLTLSEYSGTQPHHVSADSSIVKKLLEVYEEVSGKKGECIAIGGGTYVHEIEGGVAFGPEIEGEDNHLHAADEFIRIDHLLMCAKMMALAICKICSGD